MQIPQTLDSRTQSAFCITVGVPKKRQKEREGTAGMFSESWLQRFRDLLGDDAEMKVVGDWFTLSMSLTSGDDRCIVQFERGRLVQWHVSPRLGVPCAFGFRASSDIWRKYMSHPPEPLYHDVFAMLMRVPGFVLEGDSLIAMQHARALHRVMKVMRLVGEA
jgi:hypothetical protein